jgi:hypothetical protein
LSFIIILACLPLASHGQVTSRDSLMSLNELREVRQNVSDSLAMMKPDTLRKIEEYLERSGNSLNALQHSVKQKIDSMTKLKAPDTLTLQKLDKVNQRVNRLRAKIAGIQKKLSVPDEAGETQEVGIGQQATRMPEFNLPEGTIPAINIPDLVAADANLPTDNLDVEVPDVKIPELKISGQVQEYRVKANELSERVSDFELNDLEEKVEALDAVGDLKSELEKADQMKRYYDPAVAKEEALNKAKEGAVNHFLGHEEELKTAMEKLSNLKSKYQDTEAALDLFAKKQRPLKGKPLIERFIPGITLQIQHRNAYWLDLSPTVGFMISRKFTAGVGYNQRIAYSFDDRDWYSKHRAYGFRIYGNFVFKEFWGAHVEVDYLNIRSQPLSAPAETVSPSWIASYFAGLRREMRISNTLRAHFTILYNLRQHSTITPYTDRINVRTGVEFRLHKRRKDSIRKN